VADGGGSLDTAGDVGPKRLGVRYEKDRTTRYPDRGPIGIGSQWSRFAVGCWVPNHRKGSISECRDSTCERQLPARSGPPAAALSDSVSARTSYSLLIDDKGRSRRRDAPPSANWSIFVLDDIELETAMQELITKSGLSAGVVTFVLDNLTCLYEGQEPSAAPVPMTPIRMVFPR
jgi:hypothetical protein